MHARQTSLAQPTTTASDDAATTRKMELDPLPKKKKKSSDLDQITFTEMMTMGATVLPPHTHSGKEVGLFF